MSLITVQMRQAYDQGRVDFGRYFVSAMTDLLGASEWERIRVAFLDWNETHPEINDGKLGDFHGGILDIRNDGNGRVAIVVSDEGARGLLGTKVVDILMGYE